MALELYLVKKATDSAGIYELYHNSSKIENLEKRLDFITINLMPGKDLVSRFEKRKRYKLLKSLYTKPKDFMNSRFIQKYFTNPLIRLKVRRLAKLQNSNFKALKAASLVGDVNVNYAPGMSKKEVRKCYKRAVRREIVKNSIGLGINLTFIGLCYTPFTILIPSISIPFMIVGWQNLKNLGTILKGRKGINFVPNDQVSVLEEVVDGKEDAEELKNQDLMQYYSTHYGEQ